MDHYSILGVSRNATPEEIKKAYRKLAMKHHPDRGGDAAKLQEINKSYEILKDPVKRAQYDNPQPRFSTNNMHGGFGNFDDVLNEAFGFRRPRHPRNADIKIGVTISFEEILTGKKIIAAYRLRNGKEETVNLDIPPGADHGDTVKFQELGDNSFPGRRGDLYVVIKITRKPGWERNNDDLITSIKVNCLEMITGCKTKVNTLDGRGLELTIPAGTKNGTTFSVPQYGIPNIRTGTRGKLLIHVDAEIPKITDTDLLNKLQEVYNEIGKVS